MFDLSKLTIIIPSRNRPQFALRSLQYWSGKSANIILMDGSSSPIPTHLLQNIDSNICYYHLPVPFPERLAKAADLLKTKYCVLLSDDEFFLPSALVDCINFLDNNPEYVACGGRILGFKPDNNGIKGILDYSNLANFHQHDNRPEDRMLNHMKSYVPALSCAVASSHLWKEVSRLYALKEFPVFALWELELNMILSFAGKSIILENLMLLRSYGETEPIRNNIPSLNTKNEISKLWFNREYESVKSEFIEFFSETLKKVNTIQNLNYDKAVDNAITAYCEFRLNNQKKTFRSLLRKSLEPILPKCLFSILQKVPTTTRNIFFKKSTSIPNISLVDAAHKLTSEAVAVNFDELIIVIGIIENFHKVPFSKELGT